MAQKLQRDANFNLQAFGQAGFDSVGASETVNSHNYIAITALDDVVISATASEGDSLTSTTIPKGLTIFGRFTSITVTSGKILAYREVL